nr:mitogen-activated protein kinase kinase kinase 10-like [Camelus dromedarius]
MPPPVTGDDSTSLHRPRKTVGATGTQTLLPHAKPEEAALASKGSRAGGFGGGERFENHVSGTWWFVVEGHLGSPVPPSPRGLRGQGRAPEPSESSPVTALSRLQRSSRRRTEAAACPPLPKDSLTSRCRCPQSGGAGSGSSASGGQRSPEALRARVLGWPPLLGVWAWAPTWPRRARPTARSSGAGSTAFFPPRGAAFRGDLSPPGRSRAAATKRPPARAWRPRPLVSLSSVSDCNSTRSLLRSTATRPRRPRPPPALPPAAPPSHQPPVDLELESFRRTPVRRSRPLTSQPARCETGGHRRTPSDGAGQRGAPEPRARPWPSGSLDFPRLPDPQAVPPPAAAPGSLAAPTTLTFAPRPRPSCQPSTWTLETGRTPGEPWAPQQEPTLLDMDRRAEPGLHRCPCVAHGSVEACPHARLGQP